jgi:hypothetical protein
VAVAARVQGEAGGGGGRRRGKRKLMSVCSINIFSPTVPLNAVNNHLVGNFMYSFSHQRFYLRKKRLRVFSSRKKIYCKYIPRLSVLLYKSLLPLPYLSFFLYTKSVNLMSSVH